MSCPFCDPEIPLVGSEAIQRTHYKACSEAANKTLKDKIQTHLPDHPDVAFYHWATSFFIQGTNRFPYGGTWLGRVMIQVVRMWRANEILGRNDYLEQLEEIQPHVVMQTRDKLCISDPHPPLTFQTIHLIKEMFKRVGKSRWPQVVAAIDEKSLREHCYTYINDSSVPDKLIFTDKEIDFFNEHRDDGTPIRILGKQFDEELDNEDRTYEAVVTWGVLNQQLLYMDRLGGWKSRDGRGKTWTDDQDKILLQLLGEALPQAECARRLNAANARSGEKVLQATMWTQDEVVERIDQMLTPDSLNDTFEVD